MSKVLVEERTLRGLVRDSLELIKLDTAGVDNWIGYDEVETPTKEEIDQYFEDITE